MRLPISLDQEKIEAFCRRWKIKEFALFGSVLREDFGPDSDIDVLVTFEPEGGITFDNRVDMLDEYSHIVWESDEQLKEQLYNLICAVVGRGATAHEGSKQSLD
jgi:uncharacterized protein